MCIETISTPFFISIDKIRLLYLSFAEMIQLPTKIVAFRFEMRLLLFDPCRLK